jgi:hypothetical protein
MGLLDEAIRDHLELKRRRGADPTEVAREEHEALEPVFPDEPRPEEIATISEPGEFDDVDYTPAPKDPPAVAAPALEDVSAEPFAAPESLPPLDHALGEETAELDMQAFLDADAQTAQAEPTLPEQIPGQERLTFE